MNSGTLATEQPSAACLSDKVAAAERCDAGGDHERAIDLLAAACQDGDVEAMTRLGKRLLIGANAPHRPADAVVLLTKAADLGGAEAAARYAVLAAIGVHVEQSWNHALAAIVFAAERGLPAARGQLAVLSDDVTLASEATAGSVTDPRVWARLAQAIDLRQQVFARGGLRDDAHATFSTNAALI